MNTRLTIIGNSGSGKSTLAKALSQELKLPVFHLDRELLDKNYQKIPYEEQLKIQDRILKKPAWIIEGNYGQVLPERIKESDLVIFLNISRVITIPRVFIRAYKKGGQHRDTVPDGADQTSISWEFFKWFATYSRREKARKIKGLCQQYNVPFLSLPNLRTAEQVRAIKSLL